MKLIIVESPHKSQTISKFLGKDYMVLASKGHIRDLASSGKMGLGVDIEDNFKPTYEISSDKYQTVKELKSAVKKADEVYLATDPDREGEAISWHLAQVLGLDVTTTKRLEFHEITKPAILKALENPRTIDMALVESQETRRIIDRLMGYRLSYLLQKKIRSRSAGRVQSVVLEYVVNREKEIQAFVPQEYWTIDAMFLTGENKFKASLSQYQGKDITIPNEEKANEVLSALPSEFVIKSVKTETKTRVAQPPFTTATLQQAAFSQFHFSTKKTASIAQKLYEGEEINGSSTGLITYMRTDSIRLSDEFKWAAHSYIENHFGKEYLGYARTQKADKNVQDAHEAIRPTNLDFTPEIVKPYLTNDEYNLYVLIYDRALASLMAPRKDAVSTVVLNGNGYDFVASATKSVFDGYYKVYGKYEEKAEASFLPTLKEGEKATIEEPTKTQHFTKGPVRYNEGSIVKQMQKDGIGRPSTYAPTISTLLSRDYIKTTKGALVPTEQGILTSDKLSEYFPKYMDVGYTANMESNLDLIAEKKIDRNELLRSFWGEFIKYFASAEERMEKVKPTEVGRTCPKCGSPLVERHGKYGDFVGCSNYPSCDYIEKEAPKVVDEKVCPKCGHTLVIRQSKKGKFIGCSNYPKCNYMEDMEGKPLVKEKKKVEIPEDAPICPKCHTGHLVEKTSRWGKKFIGCSNYPKCKYIQKDEKEDEE